MMSIFNMRNYVINGKPSDWHFMINDADVANAIASGQKPILPGFWIDTDAGKAGSTFAVFKLPRFRRPVLFGKLRIQVKFATTDGPDRLPINLWEISNLGLLEQALWTDEEYEAATGDVVSGRKYGTFSVVAPDGDGPSADNGRVFEVPLSYDAVYDINVASGHRFGIGIANGDGWTLDYDRVEFLKPVDGGVLELVVGDCRSFV